MKGLILYKGKYGATKQYAEWLAEETGFPIIEADKFNIAKLQDFDTIIIGSSVYFGKLKIRSWLKHNWRHLSDKKLFLFIVSGTPPDETGKLNEYVRTSVPREIVSRIDVSFFHGKLIIEELSGWDRFLLKMGSKIEGKNAAPKVLVNYNEVRRENLRPLLGKLQRAVQNILD